MCLYKPVLVVKLELHILHGILFFLHAHLNCVLLILPFGSKQYHRCDTCKAFFLMNNDHMSGHCSFLRKVWITDYALIWLFHLMDRCHVQFQLFFPWNFNITNTAHNFFIFLFNVWKFFWTEFRILHFWCCPEWFKRQVMHLLLGFVPDKTRYRDWVIKKCIGSKTHY